MLGYLIQRLLLFVPTFFGVTFLGFAIMLMAPGDPVDLYFAGGVLGGTQAVDPEKLADLERAKEEMRRELGLDRPIPLQYVAWLERLARGDLGTSFKDRRPVLTKIRERVWITVIISVLTILISYLVAIPLGIYSSVRPDTWLDRISTLSVFMLYSLPVFWIGTLIIIYLCGGDYWALFPPGGLRSLNYDESWSLWRKLGDYAHHLAMPLLCSTYTSFAALSRFMRTSMLENARQDYVRTARAKGLRERVVILKHILRNSLIPIVTILSGILPALIGGSVIIETIFSIPGLGQLGYQAVLARDYPVVMGLFSVASFLTLLGILIADIGLAIVDPRISFGRGRA
jgi:peptide/nickel transport system permease protein